MRSSNGVGAIGLEAESLRSSLYITGSFFGETRMDLRCAGSSTTFIGPESGLRQVVFLFVGDYRN